jgi:cytochrome c
MDRFELNKILGAVLGTSLCLLSVHLAADTIFTPEMPAKPGYQIAVQENTSAVAETSKKPPEETIAVRLASADVDRGKSASRVCMACHTFEKGGPNRIGPNLWNVVDRARASEGGYDYSSAMKVKGGKWTYEELDKFLTHPQANIPGTKMTFGGIQNARQRADLIDYLRTISDNPAPLPKVAAAPALAAPAARNPPTQSNQNSPSQSK